MSRSPSRKLKVEVESREALVQWGALLHFALSGPRLVPQARNWGTPGLTGLPSTWSLPVYRRLRANFLPVNSNTCTQPYHHSNLFSLRRMQSNLPPIAAITPHHHGFGLDNSKVRI